MHMQFENLITELAEGVLTITLNRPEKLNALHTAAAGELLNAFDEADQDDQVRVVIVTGAGRAFCSGADLSGGSAAFDPARASGAAPTSPMTADGRIDYSDESVRDGGGRITLRIFKCVKPVIAAINGAAVGIGVTMTLPMDVRLACETARFAFPFSRRGIVPEAASSWFLPRVVGISRAMEWCVTGRLFDAREALDCGLVRSVHTPEELMPAARMLAREIADNTAPVSIALTRQMMWRGLTMSEPMEAHRIDSRAVYSRARSADAKEGVRSFFAKETPRFTDRVSTNMPDFFPWWNDSEYR
jgi:enoyl-CoA hydratase/carnithine racemase